MIDYTKLVVPVHHREALLGSLDFQRPVNEDTGEVATSRSRVAQFGPALQKRGHSGMEHDALRRAMQFHLTPTGRVLLDGSWHKYAQAGANYGAFTLPQFSAGVTDLCAQFALDPATLELQVLEAGVNIIPPTSTRAVLRRLVCHREGMPFAPMRSRKGRSLGFVLERSDYILKLYDKGAQYGLPYPLLRVEVKFIKSRRFGHLGIHTVADLLDGGHWERLANELLVLFDQIIIEEPDLDMHALTAPERKLVDHAGDHRYWAGLTDKDRHRARQRYQRIVSEHAHPSLKAQLRDAIAAACIALREPPLSQNGEVLPVWVPPMIGEGPTALPSPEIGEAFTVCPSPGNGEGFTATLDAAHATPATNEVEEVHPSVMGENLPSVAAGVPPRRCATCGLDISHQASTSKRCSERRIGRAGKRCRNTASNRTRTRKAIEQRGMLLFDHVPFFKPLGPSEHHNTGSPA